MLFPIFSTDWAAAKDPKNKDKLLSRPLAIEIDDNAIMLSPDPILSTIFLAKACE